jgi:hypothetical protein
MLIEAYVRKIINDFTFECLVAINNHYTRQQQFVLIPLNKKNNSFQLEDILHRGIWIWKHPIFKGERNYLGKIFYTKDNKIHIIHQGFEEILKKIE